jgi:hypothetical protein
MIPEGDLGVLLNLGLIDYSKENLGLAFVIRRDMICSYDSAN